MEKFIKDQIVPTLLHFPPNLIKSYFTDSASLEAKECIRKAGGFICGVCHPSDNYAQIKGANIGWVRTDIPYPFECDGSISESYTDYKKRMSEFAENGLKVMAVTPYPSSFIKAGIDPRLPENESRVMDVARFMAEDLQGVVGGLQITNEMGIPRFTIPLTMPEAARFIGIQAKAMRDVKGDILVGYNSGGPQADLHKLMKPYHQYCDYVGIDIYIGCFANVGNSMWLFDAMLRYLTTFTGKPVLLQEFGYIGAGAPKTKEEKKKLLEKYGASSEKEARQSIESFVSRLPEGFARHIAHLSPDKSHWGDLIFKSDLKNHLYCELPKRTVIKGYPHTPEGQARFFSHVIPRIKKLDFTVGMMIYCYADSGACYVCSQTECPTETKWGLVDMDGNEKPAYYAVRKAFGEIRNKSL